MSDNQKASKSRNTFSDKWGFILASAGSAVGLGNIWRFPYCAAEGGGGSCEGNTELRVESLEFRLNSYSLNSKL